MNAYENIDLAIGKHLQDTGKTQQDFADEMGFSANTLRWKRRGDTDWQFSEILKVAEILGVDPNELTNEQPV